VTATVTATAATCDNQQRPTTAHNARTICANWGYVRPEKQTVEDRSCSAATAANTAAKPLDNSCPGRTTVECRPSTRTATDGPVEDWAAEALDGLAAKTVRSHVDLLRPVTMLIGNIPLRDLTAHDVRRTLNKLAETRSTRTIASTHNVLVRAIRHAEANDHVGRNVASFVKPPQGKTGRPSRAMTAAEAAALLAAANDHPRLGAYVILSLTTGIRTEEARALRWDHVDLDGDPDARLPVPPSIAVWRSVRLHGDTKTEKSRRTLALPQNAVTALREHRKWQAEARLAAGPLWQDTGPVFTSRRPAWKLASAWPMSYWPLTGPKSQNNISR
jgi:integrase